MEQVPFDTAGREHGSPGGARTSQALDEGSSQYLSAIMTLGLLQVGPCLAAAG